MLTHQLLFCFLPLNVHTMLQSIQIRCCSQPRTNLFFNVLTAVLVQINKQIRYQLQNHASKQIGSCNHPPWVILCGFGYVFWGTNKVRQTDQGLAESSPILQRLHHWRVLRNFSKGHSQKWRQNIPFLSSTRWTLYKLWARLGSGTCSTLDKDFDLTTVLFMLAENIKNKATTYVSTNPSHLFIH